MCERWVEDRREEQHIDPHSIGHNCVSFPFSWAAQPGAWGPSLSGTCSSIQHLISNSSDLWFVWSPTDWISYALSYIIVQRPPSCGRHKSHSFNLTTVKVIFWYSSTGCTCYLHRCISYFDFPAGSEVNMQHSCSRALRNVECSFLPSLRGPLLIRVLIPVTDLSMIKCLCVFCLVSFVCFHITSGVIQYQVHTFRRLVEVVFNQ